MKRALLIYSETKNSIRTCPRKPSPSQGRQDALLFTSRGAILHDTMYDIDSTTPRYEATLVGRKLGDVTNESIDSSVGDVHAMRKQVNYKVACAVCWTSLLPNRNRPPSLPSIAHFFRNNLVEEHSQPLK